MSQQQQESSRGEDLGRAAACYAIPRSLRAEVPRIIQRVWPFGTEQPFSGARSRIGELDAAINLLEEERAILQKEQGIEVMPEVAARMAGIVTPQENARERGIQEGRATATQEINAMLQHVAAQEEDERKQMSIARGLPEGYTDRLTSHVTVCYDLMDRLRILFGRPARLKVEITTEHASGNHMTASEATVDAISTLWRKPGIAVATVGGRDSIDGAAFLSQVFPEAAGLTEEDAAVWEGEESIITDAQRALKPDDWVSVMRAYDEVKAQVYGYPFRDPKGVWRVKIKGYQLCDHSAGGYPLNLCTPCAPPTDEEEAEWPVHQR